MSTIGKIFAFVNLALAALFVGWAANASQSNQEFKVKWNDALAAQTRDNAEHKATIEKLNASNRELENARTTLTQERTDARNEADRVKKDLETRQADNAQLRGSVEKFAATLAGIEENAKKLQADKDKALVAQRDAEDARRKAEEAQSAAEGKMSDLDQTLRGSQETVASLERAKKTLEDESKSLSTQIATLVDATGAKLSDFANVPKIDGSVIGVSMSVAPGLVAINKGATAGVRRGFTFELYDGKTYKGQARVEFVHPDMCSAILIRPVQGQTIQQGDGASTRL